MRKSRVLFTLLIAAVLCGSAYLTRPTPVLLENDEPEEGVLIIDEAVPMAGLPTDPAPELYEGLSETQIEHVDRVLELVNEARAEAGVHALTLDPALRGAAQIRAVECVGCFSHTRPDGSSYRTAITQAGVVAGYTGENVATGHDSPELVVSRWLQSEGHRKNILNANYTRIGIGLEKNTGNRYGGYSWAQLFAS